MGLRKADRRNRARGVRSELRPEHRGVDVLRYRRFEVSTLRRYFQVLVLDVTNLLSAAMWSGSESRHAY